MTKSVFIAIPKKAGTIDCENHRTMMKTLIKADLGCKIGGIYYGTIFYADNIVLLGA